MFKKTKKFLALLLTVMILAGTLPIMAFAARQDGQVRVIVENTTFTSAVDGKEPAWTGKLVDTWVDIDRDSTMMSAVVDALNKGNYTQKGAEMGYISSVNGLAAFDGGSGSGWMGTLNDWFTNEGFNAFTVAAGTLSEGDEIRILYTRDYGTDLGGTWDNNDKTVKGLSFSAGELSPSFNKSTYEYTLTLPEGTEGVVVTPTASNKNFQVRTSVGGKEYKRSAMVLVENGTVITVKCGDPAWPSMNGGSYGDADSVPAKTYTITVVEEAPTEETAAYLSNLTGSNMIFTDAFDPDVHEYTVKVPSNAGAMFVYAYLSDDAPEGSAVTASYTNTSSTAKEVVFTNRDYLSPPYHYGSLSGLIATGSLEGNSFTLTVGTEIDSQTYTFHIVREPRITQAVFYDMAGTTLKTIRLNDINSANVEFLPVGTVKMRVTGNPANATILVNDTTEMKSGDTIEITPVWGEDKTAPITLDITVESPTVSNSYTLVCYQEPDSIRIATPPTKTVYAPGEIFDPTGMVVEAVYADGTATTIDNYTIESVALLPSVTGVTISYGSNTVLQPITVGEFSFPGKGTEIEPYRLSMTEHMEALSMAVSGGITFTGNYFVMDDDITLPEEWTPVGTSLANSFKGIFDGQNHTVNVPKGNLPLFGYVVGPTIKNLNIFGSKIAGYGLINNYVVGAGNPTIDNITLKSGSSTLQSGFIGGFASGMNSITIKNSTVEEDVVIGYDKKQSKIGSFGGDFNGSIDNCVSYATVYGVNKVGGILASKGQSMGICKVTNSAFHGTIVATGNYVGGIIGSGYEAGSAPNSPCVTIQNCVSSGSITGGNKVGGILGGEPGINQCWANGIGYIQNNKFSGRIFSKGSYVGGIIGRLDSLNKYNIIEKNAYTKDCGATMGIGYVAMVDTSCETVDTSDESVVYINTAKELPKISGVIMKDHNRTDDPLGADAYKLTQMVTDEKENTAPVRKTGVAAMATVSLTLDEEYGLDLSDIFEDADGDELTYRVSVDEEVAAPANEAYTFSSETPGTYTLVLKANDGTEDSTDIYTVRIVISEDYSKLDSLIIHTGTRPSNTSVLLKNAADDYTAGLTFDPDTLSYTLAAQADTLTQLRFRPVVAESGATATIYYSGENSKDITWTSGSSTWANCLTVGRNVFTIVVTPAMGSSKQPTTYTFTIDCVPTLSVLNIGSSNTQFYLDKSFAAMKTDYELTVPNSTEKVNVTATPHNSSYTLTYNGDESNTVDISSVDKIDIVVTGGTGVNALNRTYTVNLRKVAQLGFTVGTTPTDAIVKVYDQAGAEVKAKADGSYSGLFGTYDYTYTVTKYGYVAHSGVVPETGGHLRVTLNKAADSSLEDVSAYWNNFRGSDSNMAITDVKLPIDEENINLKWHAKLGTGWSAAPSIQIIVDNSLIVMSGTSIYKLDLKTGETLATGTMVAAPNFGYTPPTYAEGMIFAPLTGGIIQAFNAKTLESLWVYRDNLGGQSLSPITYDSGYIYTGFWNGETRDSNFVCLSVTDEDATKTDEAKTATWKHTQAGGFYWAGAVVVGDAVIVGTDDGTSGYTGTSKLYSFNKFTGEVISSLNLSGDQRSSIAYDKASGKIYLTTKSGYLYSAKVNATTGVLSGLKGVNYNAQSTSTPVVYKGKVYFGTGSGISTTGSSGNLVVADANSLEMLYAIGLKGYPQCSMLLTTAYEDETGYIYLYSTYNALPGGISMIQADPNATTAAGAKLIELYDAAGFSQFCISSIINGPDGTLYYKNDSANVLAVGIPETVGVIKLINAIGMVTADSGDRITIARNAYDALNEEQRIKVSNYATLTAAEAAYKKITDRIDGVGKQIGDIGTIKYDAATKKKIDSARSAYDKLSLGEKKYVTNYSMLTDAEAQYDRLKNAWKVTNLIDAIGEVTGKSEKDINVARKAYDALSSAERALVTNYFTLTAAERKFEALDSKTGAEGEAKDKGKTEAKDKAKAESKTKVIGDGDTKAVIDGITYMVDTEAATLMKSISKLSEAKDPDKQDIIIAYKSYVGMSDKLKAQVFNYDDLEVLTNKLGMENHKDEVIGMEVEGLDWYIQIMVEEVAFGQTYDMLAGSIGNNTLIRLWDIKFINLFTEEAFKPGMSIRIRVKAPDVSEFEQMRVAHLMDDGRVEYYDCELEDGYVIWEGDSFSFYALIGGVGEATNILEEVEDTETVIATPREDVAASSEPSLTWIWILIVCLGAAGIVAFIIVIIMKRKKE